MFQTLDSTHPWTVVPTQGAAEWAEHSAHPACSRENFPSSIQQPLTESLTASHKLLSRWRSHRRAWPAVRWGKPTVSVGRVAIFFFFFLVNSKDPACSFPHCLLPTSSFHQFLPFLFLTLGSLCSFISSFWRWKTKWKKNQYSMEYDSQDPRGSKR